MGYLERDDPSWSTFLDESNQTDWGKVIISGHSQGAGHATWIAKVFRTCAAAVSISGPEDTDSSCSWVAAPGSKTHLNHMTAFSHQHEDGQKEIRANWVRLGLAPVGGVGVALDNISWNNYRALTTDVDPRELFPGYLRIADALGTRPEHCSTAMNFNTPAYTEKESSSAWPWSMLHNWWPSSHDDALYAHDVWPWLFRTPAQRLDFVSEQL